MNPEILINSKLVEHLGWTLLHSLWQIVLIALVLFALLKILHRFSANTRYLVSVFALSLSVALPVVTFVQLAGNSPLDYPGKEILQPQSSAQIGSRAQRAESFSLSAEAADQAEKIESQTIFRLENLQNYFGENLSKAFPFIVGLWLFGVMLFAFRLIGGAWQLHIYKTRGISAPNDEWQKRFVVIYDKLKITRTVKFFQSNLIETPVVIGWLKPVILVPASVFLQINPRELETIIAHELIHVRRYDAFVNFAQGIIEILFFYHPCVWWISSVIRREREFAADEAVIKLLENSHIVYANALANLEEIRLRANQKLPSLATAANGGNLMQRIQKILQKNTETGQSSSAWSAFMALALISAVLLSVFSPEPSASVNAQTRAGKKIAVGFVSIPPVDRTANPPKDADATARLLIEKLKSHRVPAVGFLLGGAISDGERLYPVRANIARLWRDAGFEIGIGNFKHIKFFDTPFDEYVAGVEKNEAVARKILAEKNLQLRYFSYPYLNTGKNAEERNRFEAWLGARGITPVKYTIDNQEWMFSYAYDIARNDNDISTMTEIRIEFIKYMSRMFDHFEAYSQEMFGRDIAQTLVLTPSRLVTDSADELFGMIERRGYKFVSMDEAQKDEALQTPENYYGAAGISWFERWQMLQGKKLRDEPRIHKTVWEIWEKSKPKSK